MIVILIEKLGSLHWGQKQTVVFKKRSGGNKYSPTVLIVFPVEALLFTSAHSHTTSRLQLISL